MPPDTHTPALTDQPARRILALWFPRLGAERMLRRARGQLDIGPLAIVRETGNLQSLCFLSQEAEAQGLRLGQPLRDALAMCPGLVTHTEVPQADAVFLTHLRRWAGKLSPWVSETGPTGLAIDLTGAAHLFGGEDGVLDLVEDDCARFGLTVQMGIADTMGAAWALAHYAGQGPSTARSGDAIDQEAYATRARAVKRRNWEKGGAAPQVVALRTRQARVAAPGQTRAAIRLLPVAALRLDDKTVAELNRVGLRRIEDVLNQPRGPLVRRFGQQLGQRMDQALGLLAEPISPAKPPRNHSVRLSFPDPIGLADDLLAGIDRMLPTLGKHLRDAGRGARRVRLEAYRTDQSMRWIEVGLARPSPEPDRIRPLLAMKIDDIDAGYGIDMLRLIATVHEPIRPEQTRRIPGAAVQVAATQGSATEDLMGRLGARVGLEAITRFHPASSHIPEKAYQTVAAAFTEPEYDGWQVMEQPRPLTLFPVELVDAPDTPAMPDQFRWRGRTHQTAHARGPERIAPEWWLDDRNWRSGTRDYWDVMTQDGTRLWLYYAHGAGVSGGWFCQGQFA
ncbi:MAG: DNA polymerase Y family protein [Pseudomonadota bacterium]